MELLHFDNTGPYAAPTLLVMLPGAYSAPQEFVDEGFVQALRERRLPVDVVVAGAKVDHYIEGQVLDRLHDQVIGPARARGVRQVWLLGISLGGLFALGYTAQRPADVDGVLTLAPYLGRRTLLAEIEAGGGPTAWAQGRQPRPDDLIEHEVWAWLARDRRVGGRPAAPLYLGYGLDDRFADAHRLLAAQLPADHSFTQAGGHDWPAWRALWQQWLARGLLGA
jgi:pimeloyl-ACP methyl ester carboxylesterase